MSSVGETLKKARLKKQLSVGDIVKLTNIRSFYIKAIEEDLFDELPRGEAYHKAFLVSYAQSVDLDTGEVISLYKHVQEQQRLFDEGRDSEGGSEDSLKPVLNKLIRPLAGIVLVGVVGFAVYYSNSKQKKKVVLPAKTEAGILEHETAEVVAPKAPVAVNAAQEEEKKVVLDLKDAALVLKTVALEDTEIELKVDGGKTKQIALKKGEIKEWPANEEFVLSLSNAGAVELSFNGSEPRILGQSGQNLRNIIFTKESGSKQ